MWRRDCPSRAPCRPPFSLKLGHERSLTLLPILRFLSHLSVDSRHCGLSPWRTLIIHDPRPTLRFLRALKRNNDREWFKARKDQSEACVREPMINVITALASDFRRFAPELVASPQKSMYRIYRDTRFSANKTPLKTHVAAGFPGRASADTRARDSTLKFRQDGYGLAAGCGRHSRRSCIACANTSRHVSGIQRLSRTSTFKRNLGELQGDRLSRVPRGFSKDDPQPNT